MPDSRTRPRLPVIREMKWFRFIISCLQPGIGSCTYTSYIKFLV
jgi:hypothetical protein